MTMPAGLGIVGLAASIGVGLIFLIAGGTKLRHRAVLEGVVANYRILPAGLVAPVARVLPYIELVVGAALIAGFHPLPQIAAIVLLLGFALSIAVNVRRGRTHIDCGCGLSGLRQSLGPSLVARNVVLAALLLPGLSSAPVLSGAELAAAGVGGLALLLCTLVFNAIDALSQSSRAAFRR